MIARHIACGKANKGFCDIRVVVTRLNSFCTLTGNRPQSLTGNIAKR